VLNKDPNRGGPKKKPFRHTGRQAQLAWAQHPKHEGLELEHPQGHPVAKQELEQHDVNPRFEVKQISMKSIRRWVFDPQGQCGLLIFKLIEMHN
jgi:hypothetical protein